MSTFAHCTFPHFSSKKHAALFVGLVNGRVTATFTLIRHPFPPLSLYFTFVSFLLLYSVVNMVAFMNIIPESYQKKKNPRRGVSRTLTYHSNLFSPSALRMLGEKFGEEKKSTYYVTVSSELTTQYPAPHSSPYSLPFPKQTGLPCPFTIPPPVPP